MASGADSETAVALATAPVSKVDWSALQQRFPTQCSDAWRAAYCAGTKKELLLIGAGVTSADLSLLNGLDKLEELWLADNALTDIAPLAALRGLVKVVLNRNSLTTLQPLLKLPRLKTIVCTDNISADAGAFATDVKAVIRVLASRGGAVFWSWKVSAETQRRVEAHKGIVHSDSGDSDHKAKKAKRGTVPVFPLLNPDCFGLVADFLTCDDLGQLGVSFMVSKAKNCPALHEFMPVASRARCRPCGDAPCKRRGHAEPCNSCLPSSGKSSTLSPCPTCEECFCEEHLYFTCEDHC